MTAFDSSAEVRTALVTGATGAIGQAIANGIAAYPGFRVILVCRDEGRAANAVHDIIAATGNEHVRYELADLSSKDVIFALAEKLDEPVHVLVNNAATTPRRRLETGTGIEMQFATNVLGYSWMMQAFSEHLARGAPARVVNVASYWAGDLDLDDLEFTRRRYDNNTAYRQSKQANRMLTVAFGERFRNRGVTVNACHPGDVNSRLSNDLGFGGHESPEEGARTPVWLATSPDVGGVTGKYFEHGQERNCRFANDHEAVACLYELCQRY